MKTIDISAWEREALGKGASGRLRREGYVPAVLYGPGIEKNLNLKLRDIDVEKAIHGHGGGNVLLRLKIEGDRGKPATVMFKTLNRDPVRDTLEHVDLVSVLMDKAVTVEIPVHLIGKAEGVTLGGILQHELRKLKVECLPDSIPSSVDVDVSGLQIGQSIHVRDLTLPEGVQVRDDGSLTVVLVASPAAEVEEKPAVEGEAAAAAAAGAAEAGKEEEEGKE